VLLEFGIDGGSILILAERVFIHDGRVAGITEQAGGDERLSMSVQRGSKEDQMRAYLEDKPTS
jgi:hypothetical protein